METKLVKVVIIRGKLVAAKSPPPAR